MQQWMKDAIKVMKSKYAWAAWHKLPNSVYEEYVVKGEHWMSEMPDEYRDWFVLLVIEAEKE
jgi:hypothetical protein